MQPNIDIDPTVSLVFSNTHPQTIDYFPQGSMQIDETDFYSFLLIKRGLAENSVRHCMCRIKIINQWLENDNLTKESIERFFMDLKNKGLKNSSLNTYRFALRHIAEYCKDRGLPHDFLDGFKAFKKKKPDIIILTPEEIEKIINTSLQYGKFEGKDCSFLDFRITTLIRFLALTGCRFSEAANLTIKHLDLSAGRAILVETKNNENRSAYFLEPLISDLKKITEGFNEEDLVFRNTKENRIHATDFSDTLKERANKAGITKRVYPHLFRHSFATQLLISGIDVAIVSKILGHKDVRTTVENYLHLADETLKEATFMHPLIRKNINPTLLIKAARETLEKFHFENDSRFTYNLSENGKSLEFKLALN